MYPYLTILATLLKYGSILLIIGYLVYDRYKLKAKMKELKEAAETVDDALEAAIISARMASKTMRKSIIAQEQNNAPAKDENLQSNKNMPV